MAVFYQLFEDKLMQAMIYVNIWWRAFSLMDAIWSALCIGDIVHHLDEGGENLIESFQEHIFWLETDWSEIDWDIIFQMLLMYWLVNTSEPAYPINVWSLGIISMNE